MRVINVGWWEGLAHAIFGVTGSNPIPELGEHVQPVADLSRPRPEWDFPAGRVPFATNPVTSTGIAGQKASVILQSPFDANLLVVVAADAIVHNTGTDVTVMVGNRFQNFAIGTDGVLTEVAIQGALDSRYIRTTAFLPRTGPRVFTARSVAGLGFASSNYNLSSRNTSLAWARLPHGLYFVLGPGGFVALQNESLGGNIDVASFGGYVVPLHKGDRA